MTEDQPAISVITDISANIFAVFIVILIVLLALPHDTPPPAPQAKPIDVRRDLVSVTRSPLTPTGMVDLLFARRHAADSVSVDLFSDRIVLVRPGEPPEELNLPLDDRSTATAAGMISTATQAPVGLYVFDHRGYAAVLKLLGGRAFREISVPAALRATVDDRQDWREGFRALIDRVADLETFREQLSRLLASPDPSQANAPLPIASGQRKGPPSTIASADPPSEGLIARLALWLQRALAIWAVLLGFGLIACVEWLGGKSRRRELG